ncbi:MAG: hypothetical protein M3512_18240 [Bacteroidota bacterium]|nr:hypothetical protein [Bacteroidota bacterium]
MKKTLTSLFLVLFMFSCDKKDDEPKVDIPQDRETILREHIFNGKTKWKLTEMGSDIERDNNGTTSKNWWGQLPECRTDNVYEFRVLSINIDEGASDCSDDESLFMSQAFFLSFSNDYSKASVDIDGEGMVKFFNVPNVFNLKAYYNHTWHFKEVTLTRLVIDALIIPSESEKMVSQTATVTIVFEKIN